MRAMKKDLLVQEHVAIALPGKSMHVVKAVCAALSLALAFMGRKDKRNA